MKKIFVLALLSAFTNESCFAGTDVWSILETEPQRSTLRQRRVTDALLSKSLTRLPLLINRDVFPIESDEDVTVSEEIYSHGNAEIKSNGNVTISGKIKLTGKLSIESNGNVTISGTINAIGINILSHGDVTISGKLISFKDTNINIESMSKVTIIDPYMDESFNFGSVQTLIKMHSNKIINVKSAENVIVISPDMDELLTSLGGAGDDFKNGDFKQCSRKLVGLRNCKDPKAYYLFGKFYETGIDGMVKAEDLALESYTSALANAEEGTPVYRLSSMALQRCIDRADPSKKP